MKELTYSECVQLRDAGFPQYDTYFVYAEGDLIPRKDLIIVTKQSDIVACPSLEELIGICGEDFDMLTRYSRVSEDLTKKEVVWEAHGITQLEGSHPKQAVAKLFLSLHTK